MLDASAQHPGRSGIETLRLTARLLGLPGTRATEMLERVGLGGAGKRRVGDYSLGMRQRLGIGTALMGDPAVLILDEPANGMDPEGIRWMRMLLHDFAAGGGTVLLSSHLLARGAGDRGPARRHRSRPHPRRRHPRDPPGRAGDDRPRARPRRPRPGPAAPPGSRPRRRRAARLRVQATAEQVGRVALASRQILLELHEGDSSGLEELFFELTATASATATTTDDGQASAA